MTSAKCIEHRVKEHQILSMKQIPVIIFCLLLGITYVHAGSIPVAYDREMAEDICNELPLDNIEGIWLYPEDQVEVLILSTGDEKASGSLPEYIISVVKTSDARLHPGDVIGKLQATAQENVYKIELATERNNELLLKPKSVLATFSKDGDSFIIKKQNSPFKGRLNLNLSRLLPGFWKIVSLGVSQSRNSSVQPLEGMVKVYPSYDGNGSSKRKIRYL